MPSVVVLEAAAPVCARFPFHSTFWFTSSFPAPTSSCNTLTQSPRRPSLATFDLNVPLHWQESHGSDCCIFARSALSEIIPQQPLLERMHFRNVLIISQATGSGVPRIDDVSVGFRLVVCERQAGIMHHAACQLDFVSNFHHTKRFVTRNPRTNSITAMNYPLVHHCPSFNCYSEPDTWRVRIPQCVRREYDGACKPLLTNLTQPPPFAGSFSVETKSYRPHGLQTRCSHFADPPATSNKPESPFILEARRYVALGGRRKFTMIVVAIAVVQEPRHFMVSKRWPCQRPFTFDAPLSPS